MIDTVNTKYKVGGYIRLSKEDENLQGEFSFSVESQKLILERYYREHNYELINFYIDDGYTGTNFDRPGFIKLIEDINKGKINMVITKDLSRLGRDYITTGEYIEKWFPMHNVRYVSILDGVDTLIDGGNNEIAPFKAIINDMYSRDNSKKVRSALKAKQLEGKWVGGCAPFGYMKDPEDKNHLVINSEEAKIVKLIFRLSLEGKNKNQIKDYLFDNKIPTPQMMRKTWTNSKYAEFGIWNTTTIKQILTNELYTGNMVQNRRSRISYKVRKLRCNSKDKWIIVENTHEPIISMNDFKRVAKILESQKRIMVETKKDFVYYPLIYCADCKGRVTISGGDNGHCHGNHYVMCNRYRRYSKLHVCTPHSQNYEKLEAKIDEIIKDILKKYLDQNTTKKRLEDNKKSLDNKTNLKNSINRIEELLNDKTNKLDKMYIDKLDEKISDDMYDRLSIKLRSEIDKLKMDKESLLEKYSNSDLDGDKRLINNLIEELFKTGKITQELAYKLIKRIEIHENKEVDIYFNFNILNMTN